MADLYAIMGPDGTFQGAAPSLDEALQHAAQFAPMVEVQEELAHDGSGLGDGGDEGLGDGELGAPGIDGALEAAGLRKFSMDEVMAVDLAQAHAALRPYFPNERFVKATRSYRRTRIYDDPIKMAKSLLGQNYKTGKQDPNQTPSNVRGLSLLPAFELAEYSAVTQRARGKQATRLQPAFTLPVRKKPNFCVGSTKACRKSCLVHSGHNDIDPYNVRTKIARSRALLEETPAFLRLLFEAVTRFEAAMRRHRVEPFVRLNVFSDLPWELIFPDLFRAFPQLQFYDYTKVTGRDPTQFDIGNYDLTFSNGGGPRNIEKVMAEAETKRVAAVFLPPYRVQADRRRYGEGLPETWLGHPVQDGDVSDVRPRDPAPGIVGLRWKIPMGRQDVALPMALQASFVLPVEEIDGVLVAPVTPTSEGVADADEDLDESED